MHVSNMSKTRANSAKDLVKRSQQVWVKVISLLGAKISLSMRDVDQVRLLKGLHIGLMSGFRIFIGPEKSSSQMCAGHFQAAGSIGHDWSCITGSVSLRRGLEKYSASKKT